MQRRATAIDMRTPLKGRAYAIGAVAATDALVSATGVVRAIGMRREPDG